ncbi:hypothetical protein [Pseudooceanicola sp. 200-1SW]|uniref:hypothetical protein n=1 Tax=Pseudooceanicola sp. 200-1SW TaxID=3425949 RepID=UPI003D7F5E51
MTSPTKDQHDLNHVFTDAEPNPSLPDGAGIILTLIGWALFLAGLLAGVAPERWVL